MGAFPEQEQPPLLGRRSSFRPEEEEEDDEYTDAFGVCFGLFLAIFAIMLVVLCIRRPGTEGMAAASPPDYFVAIDAVSGLDPSADLGRPALDPAFSLTVRVASRSFARGACVRAGTSVLVSYRGVPLAGGRAPAGPELCAGPMGAAEDGSVVARGSGVRVPGPQLDALAEDVRRGEALF